MSYNEPTCSSSELMKEKQRSEDIPKFLASMMRQGTLNYEEWKNYPAYWLKSYKNDLLGEVSQVQKECILIRAAKEGDLATLKGLEALGKESTLRQYLCIIAYV